MKHLLLVDYENVPRIDLSILDDSYVAIVFVGAHQSPPRAAKNPNTAHRFRRVDFQKIAGPGKNAADFHIACHLGRVFETSRETMCIVVSGDKGYDPLLLHLNNNGLRCRRIESFSELVVCPRCNQSHTIELHGGRWCSNCGSFASAPDPELLPSNQPGYRESTPALLGHSDTHVACDWCHQPSDLAGGIYDDGEFMCGDCIGRLGDSSA